MTTTSRGVRHEGRQKAGSEPWFAEGAYRHCDDPSCQYHAWGAYAADHAHFMEEPHGRGPKITSDSA